MKKNLILWFCVLGSNLLWSQISISGSSNVEVNTNYSFYFSCIPKNAPTGATSYRLTSWQINSSLSNMNNASVPYKNDNSEALVNKTIGTSSSISFPIKWEDISNTTQDVINVTAYYTFYDSSNSVIGSSSSDSYKDSNGNLGFKVTVYRIFSPTLSSGLILNCCSNNVLITASGYGDANLFDWTSLSGCTLVSGQGTPVITVIPDPFQSAVSATCFVGRTTAPISYIKSGSITTVKTTRTATFYPIYSVQPVTQYMCKGSGQPMKIDPQCGLISANWVAPNCTINGQGTLTPTIIPSVSIPLGTIVQVYADIQFNGGCIVKTPTIDFAIYEGSAPPIPSGSISFVPVNPNPCLDDGYDVVFIPSVPFVNGKISVSPAVIPPGRNSRLITFRVTYYNYCSG